MDFVFVISKIINYIFKVFINIKTQEYDTLKQEIESLKQEAKNMDRNSL